MTNRFLTFLLGIVLFTSCNTSKEILYFQDIVVNQPEVIESARDITVQPKDQISITVSSKDPQLAALFNLTRVQYRAGTTDLRSGNNNGEISGYTLDEKGNIDFSCHRLTPHSWYDQEPDCYPYQETVSGRRPSERPGCDRGVHESLFFSLG